MADPRDLIVVAYSPSTRKFYNVDGASPAAADVLDALDRVTPIDNIAAVNTADGSDAGTTQALANALKAKVNAILAALKEHGFMIADA